MAANGSFATSQYQQASGKGSYPASSAPRPPVPQIPGKDDLEKLENLKRIIKAGQHEFYRAVPQPEALAKLYMGVIPDSVSQDGEQQASAATSTGEKGDVSVSNPTSPVGSSSRHPRYQNKGTHNGLNRKPSATNGSVPNGATNNGHASNGNQSQEVGLKNALAASEAMDATPTQPESGSSKPPGLPVKPDVSQLSVRADSSTGRPASLPEKPNTDGRAGPGQAWQGRNDAGRSDIYDRPPPSTTGGPSQERDNRDFQTRNRSWSERKPHDRYPREGPPVKTEELPISLSDSETRPGSGPADSRPGLAHDQRPNEFPRYNESTAATDSLPQAVPGLSSQPVLRRESYPPQEPKPGSDMPPKDLHSSPHSNGIASSDGPAQSRAGYPPRASSPKRDDLRGPPSKPGPSPSSNQNQIKYTRPYRPPPNNYRPDYGDSIRRTDRMDVDEPRYADRSYRPYSPPPSDRGRAIPPSPGRAPSEYNDPRRYSNPPPPASYGAPPAVGYGGQPPRWEDDPYYKSRASHWDPSLERDRYERDPARGTWDARADRDPRDYSRGPPAAPQLDDRYAYRDVDRNSRPPPGAPAPAYSRTRPRSPSPLRRGGGPMIVDDPRPPLKRPRDDYGPPPSHHPSAAPSGGDYYSPRNPDMSRARPPPGSGDSYSSAPPPSGPPPSSGGSGSFYERTGPPPPSSSSMGSERDRDYMRGMDYASPLPPPQHAGYGRPRSPPPNNSARMGSLSSAPYDNRAPYARGPPPPAANGRDGRPYGMPPPRP